MTGLGAGILWPRPQPHYLTFFVNYTLAVYIFTLYVKFLYVGKLYTFWRYTLGSFIRWEALYVGKHYTLGSFTRSDVICYDIIRLVFIRSDVIRSDVICSDVIRSDVIRSVIIRSVGESLNGCKKQVKSSKNIFYFTLKGIRCLMLHLSTVQYMESFNISPGFLLEDFPPDPSRLPSNFLPEPGLYHYTVRDK
jgi:hypothetical protein